MTKIKSVIMIGIALLLVSCAKTEEEEVRSAIDEARYHLSSMDCDKAMDVLTDVSFQSDNADYISVYASTQACEGGYRELDILFGGNLDNLSSGNLLTTLAAFTSSNETEADSTVYSALDSAITTLISYDGASSNQPDTASRKSKFGIKKSGDLSMQALYLLLVQLGKHFALYGNGGTDGTKGGGTLGNNCIFSYASSADAVQWINNNTMGSCNNASGSEGSDFLESPVTAATIKTRLCRGIVYYNNMLDILGNTSLPGSDQLGDVSNIQTALTTLMTTAELAETGIYNDDGVSTNAIGTLKVITSQAGCEAINIERIEKFYAMLFEFLYS